ncbi:MAG: DNA repair protein RadA [Patescibacteria group bacterium]|jgi:DNA repair protein RadA/Sms
MSKTATIYVCSNCGAQSLKWSGRCLECGKWGTLQNQIIEKKEKPGSERLPAAKTTPISEIDAGRFKRIKTGIEEADRVLGGGIVPGSLILLGGEPGIGKSTIVAQIASSLPDGSAALYASGEESAEQIKLRADRLAIKEEKINFLNETRVEKIIATAEELRPELLIIDSIQTIYTDKLESEPGSASQIRASAAQIMEMAKNHNIAVILIGHITKDGSIAGPKTLEHLVDTVIYLETDKSESYRILRAAKNRFGSASELGIFEMTAEGFREVKNPSLIFLHPGGENLSGSAVSAMLSGSRPFLLEIQALVTKTIFGYPVRRASGFDINRLAILAAVLGKRAAINLSAQDIILNIAGGLKTSDPALDLAVAAAIASSLLNLPLNRKTIILGEVGLGGEIRNIKNLEQRLYEAARLGFEKAVIPDFEVKTEGLEIIKMKNLREIIDLLKLNRF